MLHSAGPRWEWTAQSRPIDQLQVGEAQYMHIPDNITYLLIKQVISNHYQSLKSLQYSMSDTAICLVTSLQIRQWAPHKLFRCECDHIWLLMSCHCCWNPKWSHRLRTKSPFGNEDINILLLVNCIFNTHKTLFAWCVARFWIVKRANN